MLLNEDFASGMDEYIKPERIIQIASDLINLRSDYDGDMEYNVAVYLRDFLSALGLDVQFQHVELKRYNVIARLTGKGGGKTLMYSGHMDVVPPGSETNWATPPFCARFADDKLYGRGSADMKGGIASVLHVIELFVTHNVELSGDVLFVFDVDEEISNKGIRMFFNSDAKIDACIVGEPTQMGIGLGNKGVLGLWVTIFGKKAHAAMPEVGINPINHASELIQRIKKYQKEVLCNRVHSQMGNPTMTVTMVQGGKELNSVPPQCELRIDRRLVLGETKESCLEEFEDLLSGLRKDIPDFSCSYRVTTFCPPGEVSEDALIVKIMRDSICPGDPLSVPAGFFRGTCEAPLIAERWDIPVIICGPGSMNEAHTENEFVDVEELVLAGKAYSRFFMKFLR